MSIENEKKGILLGNNVYKPFRYPWAHQFWETQQKVHWLPEEVPLAEDVQDCIISLFNSSVHISGFS